MVMRTSAFTFIEENIWIISKQITSQIFAERNFSWLGWANHNFFFILSGLIFMDQHIFDFSHVFNFADFPIFVYENAEIWAKPANKKE